jgi:3-deoxy-D-manno-octulosonic-acid transferase
MRWLYSIATCLLLPWALSHLLWRSRRQPEYLQHIGERLGFYQEFHRGPLIWLHAVSVGETRAAEPLIRLLRTHYPGHRILLTHATPTGRRTGKELFGDAVVQAYLPYDFPWAVQRFLRHYRPAVGILMETELWPNLVRACNKHATPVYLVNARLSEKSARGYRWLAPLTRATLRGLAGIAAQTEDDARRFEALGAEKVSVTGNIKFDRLVPEDMQGLGKRFRAQFGTNRPVFLAASTREGEETLILDALARHPVPGLLIVIVPRHPQRFGSVAELIARRGLRYQRRSENRLVEPDCQVVLGDSMGELFAYYAACDLAFVGGSLLPLGGQNLLEACAVGTPVLIGPHTFNFAEITRLALTADAALRIDDAAALAEAVATLLRDPARRQAMGAAGIQFAQAHRGATQRTLQILKW